MRYWRYTFMLFALLVISAGVLHPLIGWGGAPDLVMLIVVMTAVFRKDGDFVFVAFVGGTMAEWFGSFPAGSLTLGYLLAGLCLNLAFRRWVSSEPGLGALALVIAAAMIFVYFWIWLYTSLLLWWGAFELSITFGQLQRLAIPALLYNLLLAYPVLIIFKKWFLPRVQRFELN